MLLLGPQYTHSGVSKMFWRNNPLLLSSTFKRAPKGLHPVSCGRPTRFRSNIQTHDGRVKPYLLANKMSVSHEQRTIEEPRENEIHDVVLSHITEINRDVRLLRLEPSDRFKNSKAHSDANLLDCRYSYTCTK